MPLRLLIDECILDKLLEKKLREVGHDILTVTEAGLIRKPDHAILEAAIATDRMIITVNCADFVELATTKLAKQSTHPGILLVYRYNVSAKEMSYNDIIKAITNLENTGIELKNQCHKLNNYNY